MKTLHVSMAIMIVFSASTYSQEESRVILGVSQDENGYIVTVCNPNETWMLRSLQQAVSDIERGVIYRTYCTGDDVYGRVKLKLPGEDGTTRTTITTVGDESKCNNLDKLPDCSLLLLSQGES